jgi:hypothetical protein
MNPSDPTGPLETGAEPNNRVAELLAGYLLSTGPRAGPGTDGLTVAEAAGAFYQAAARAGQVPDLAELTRRHPEQADAISAFLSTNRTR